MAASSSTQVIHEGELPRREVQTYSVLFDIVEGSAQLRLDASFYNPNVAQALAILRESKMDLVRLGILTQRIFFPPRCSRTYVDREHGIPFLQGSHVVHFKPADLKYVSKTAQKHLPELVISRGWLLITRSGTVGRAVIVPDAWHEWAASEHIFRVVPKNPPEIPTGYLYAFLSSFAGQAQLTAQIYGGVVDELTEDQVANVLIPVPKTSSQHDWMAAVNQRAVKSLRLRSASMSLDLQAIAECEALGRSEAGLRAAESGPDEPATR